MRIATAGLWLLTSCLAPAGAIAAGAAGGSAPPPLLTAEETAALAQEISGESAMRTVEAFARLHRMRGSAGFDAAGELVLAELRRFGYSTAAPIVLPADGRIFYGTQRSRPAWQARFAELWEVDAAGVRRERLASWDEAPLGLAQDSESTRVTGAELIDIGAGTADGDYTGKDLAGRLVLTSSQPEAVAELAVGRRGAAGILSWAQNQRQGWWGEDESLVRWGHLDTFAATPTFAFMISPARARLLRDRLAAGERILFSAVVEAGAEPGAYRLPTAVLPGADPAVGDEEIVFSCHLDHPRPGANDNASGCAAILEVARTLAKLVQEGRLPRPRRSLRFVWPPEIEGTHALLAGRPDLAQRFRAAIHLDMVGGGLETGAVFHVTRGPASLPSFVHDLAAAQAEWVNGQTMRYAATGAAPFPLVAAGGGKEPLRAELADLSLGSDHQVYNDSSFGIPAIYLNDWPDRYIHTDRDLPENLDPTKLERAAFLSAAIGWTLANLADDDAAELWRLQRAAALRRAAVAGERQHGLERAEGGNLARFALQQERALFASLRRFATPSAAVADEAERFLVAFESALGTPATPVRRGGVVYRRNPAHPGTTETFGYAWLPDHLGVERTAALALPAWAGAWGSDYAYEALNLVDGRRTTLEIRDDLAAIYGPVPLAMVEEYLEALLAAHLLMR